MPAAIHANQIGNMVGAQSPIRPQAGTCACGALKSERAKTCNACKPRRPVKRSAAAMDNHRRYSAALETGRWTEAGMLIAKGPPTWEEIEKVAPEVVIKYRSDVVIRAQQERG